jgi:hypothetical protein
VDCQRLVLLLCVFWQYWAGFGSGVAAALRPLEFAEIKVHILFAGHGRQGIDLYTYLTHLYTISPQCFEKG